MSNSQKNLVASLQLCVSLDKDVGYAIYSRFNVMLLSFLCQRGFIRSFSFSKKGSNGFLLFCIRRVNGTLLFNNIWSPLLTSRDFKSKFTKYKTCRALLSTFTSEFVVISTNRGLMTVNEAVAIKAGGSIICVIS